MQKSVKGAHSRTSRPAARFSIKMTTPHLIFLRDIIHDGGRLQGRPIQWDRGQGGIGCRHDLFRRPPDIRIAILHKTF